MEMVNGMLKRTGRKAGWMLGAGTASLLLISCAPATAVAPAPPPAEAPAYEMYVTNESADVVSRVTFDPQTGFEEVRQIRVGMMPTELDSPHGVAVSPDGEFYYVTLGHGTPFGHLWKFAVEGDTLVDRVQLGRFPASLDVTPDGEHVFVANFNLHGDHVPSDVSVIHGPTMQEVARPVTCVMPHGNRVDESGAYVYSTCMHSEQLVRIDTRTFEVAARFSVRPGAEGSLALDDRGDHAPIHEPAEEHADHHGDHPPAVADCRPTWATPGRGERAHLVYVPCNGNREVLEIDTREWEVLRRFPTGENPYNSDITPDGGTLVVTLRGDQGVTIFDLDSGDEVRTLRTTRPITHGVVISQDGRYAFVTNEAIGSTPGTLEAIDLRTAERVAEVELSYQPTGVDLLPR